MKKLFFLFLVIFSLQVFAQLDYVPIEHRVYDYLERMEYKGLIENYNSFEKPKTRKEVAGFLADLSKKEIQLSHIDKEILNRFCVEFEFDINGSLAHSASMFGKEGGYSLFSNLNKYLYYISDSSKINLFLNFVENGEFIYNNDRINNTNANAILVQYGGLLRGTILNRIGFMLQATNGFTSGDRATAMLNRDVKQNFKFNEAGKGSFFDETLGYVTADFDMAKIKFGRDRVQIGYGTLKPILDDNSAPYNFLSFDFKYKALSFSYLHGKILGSESFIPDTLFGDTRVISDKYIGYHRFGINFSKDFSLGLGEIVIYANRSLDFSYMNPFTFYKSIEHSNQDRDNSMMFFDFANNSINGLKFFSTLLLDDLSFDKIGNGWYGNLTMWHLGVQTSLVEKYLPLDFQLEYLRIEPYVFTHRIQDNNFTNYGVPLNTNAQPNSELIFSQFNYRLSCKLSFSLRMSYGLHGANILNNDGSVKVNVGGDINLAHRAGDSETVKFLDGEREYKRFLGLAVIYEPYYDISLKLNLHYFNNSLARNVSEKSFQSFFTLSAKL